jgi:hypothetical protein
MTGIQQAQAEHQRLTLEQTGKRDAATDERGRLQLSQTDRHQRATEGLTARGQNMTDARGREANALKAQEIGMGGKPPPGYTWEGPGKLAAIPGGPGDKLPEAQQKQVVGTQNLSNASTEYRKELKNFGLWDTMSPAARAGMGTKYKNMMLQAKEAYNLGVLNGPDLQILESVITDPASFKGVMTPNSALDRQAVELDRIMTQVSNVSANRRPQDGAPPMPAPTGALSPEEQAELAALKKRFGR